MRVNGNFAVCGRTTNQYRMGTPPYPYGENMYDFETAVQKELTTGSATSMLYGVLPVYSGGRVIPTEFDMYAVGWDASGSMVYNESAVVQNVVYLHGVWVNIGEQPEGTVNGGFQEASTS